MSQHTEFVTTILSSYKPIEVSNIVRHRYNHAELLNEEISDWLRERAKIEEIYASSLAKLSQRIINEIPNSGIFAGVWESVINQTRSASKASASFSEKISRDIELPLRKFCTKSGQWSDIKELNSQLESIAQSFNQNDEKVEKLKRKSMISKHNHQVENAQHSLTENRGQWESHAPYILEQIATVDESRLGILKNTLISYETLEADLSQRIMKSTEVVLNNVLSFEPIDDIAAFSAQAGKSLERSTSHRNFNRGSISEFSDVHSNKTESIYESPRSSKKEETGSSKLRSKVGSIFRPRKGKSASVSLSNSQHPHIPQNKPNTFTPHAIANISESQHNSTSYSANGNSDISNINRISKPAPPPARKSSNGVTLSTSPRPDEVNNSIPHSTDNFLATSAEASQGNQSFPPDQREYGNQGLKFTIEDKKISDGNEEEDSAALSNIATQLESRSTPSRRGKTRREVQSTLFSNIVPSEVDHSVPANVPITESPITSLTESQNFHLNHGVISPENAPVLPITPTLKTNLPIGVGLKAGITEHLSANVIDGQVERSSLVGEVSFAFEGEPQAQFFDIKLDNFNHMDKITPNYSIMRSIGPTTFRANFKDIAGSDGKLGFKLLLKNAQQLVPVDFTPFWRIEPDKSRLMLTYKLADSYLINSPIVLKDVTITVPVEGGNATAAHSRPKVVFNQHTQSVVWKFDELVVRAGVEEKLLCQFDTDGSAVEGRQGIDIKFSLVGYSGFSLSYTLKDSTTEEAEWIPVNTLVSMYSGKFTLHADKNLDTTA